MMFQVVYTDNGYKFATKNLNESQKDNYVQILTNAGIKYEVIERDDIKIQIIGVVFSLDDSRVYTFEDSDRIAKLGDIVEVECTDGRKKNALVKAIGLRTPEQVKTFCDKIGYKALGTTTKLVWRPSRK